MAEVTSDSSPDTDREFDPTADMLVHEFDDEGTLDEEEAMSGESCGNELNDLEKEGDMPLEELLAMYGYGGSGPPLPPSEPHQESRSSSEEEILSNQDLTLDKDEIARDLLKDDDIDNETSVNDLIDSVDIPSQTVRLLRSHSHAGSEDESDDEDYQPQKDEDWKKTINVGSEFQAIVPSGLDKYGDSPAYENEDRLLWDPTKLGACNVEEFLTEVHKRLNSGAQGGVHSIPIGAHIRDDEQALYLLLQCGHNVEEAIRRRKMQAVPPSDPMSLWSEEECRNFETGLRLYGKDFYLIQQNKVRTRSVGELVQFYYLWKKTERHDVFANKTRLEKKKYALHPGITDYMERFLDEQENSILMRPERSASPTNSLLYGDPKRHHHEHTQTNTEDADKPASPEEVAEAMELVTKVVDSSAIFTPLKDSVLDFHTALQSCTSTSSSSDPPGPVAAVCAPTTTLSINCELKEGKSAEHAVDIANGSTTSPSNGDDASSTCSSHLPIMTSSAPSLIRTCDTIQVNGLEPVSKKLKTSQDDVAMPIPNETDSLATKPILSSQNSVIKSPKQLNSVHKSPSKPDECAVSSHIGGNVEFSINSVHSSTIQENSITSKTLSTERPLRPAEPIAQ